jgi:hypothetical protein
VLAQAVVAPGTGQPSDRAPVVVRVTSGGFSWGDAVIGAAAGSGLTLLVGGLAVGRRNDTSERSPK